MNPPAFVKVGPYDYALVPTRGLLRREGCLGKTEHVPGRISYEPEQSHGQIRSTVLHEVLHAVIGGGGVHHSKWDEEKAIRAIEGGLLGVLRDNPDLVAWLVA